MADKRLVLRFSEEMYATKEDVKRELRLSLVDNFWNDILDYRENFMRPLALYDAEQKSLYLTMCGLVQNQVNQIERKLSKNMMQYNKNKHLRFSSYFYLGDKLDFDILKRYAEVKGIDIDDDTIIKLLSPHPVPTYERHMRLARFNETLKLVKNSYLSPIDEDYLAKLYSSISGNDELTHLYRYYDPKTSSSSVLVNRIYDYMPARLLEKSMGVLLNFIKSSALPSLLKAIVFAYYIYYAKPFDDFNEEMAILLALSIFASSDLDESAFSLNIVDLFVRNDRLDALLKEVQKSGDVTYFLLYALKKIETNLDELNKLYVETTLNEVKKERLEEVPSKPIVQTEPTSLFDFEQEVAPSKEESVELVKPKEVIVETKKEEIKQYEGSAHQAINLSSLALGLDEKDAQKLEEHLLESNPRLKRGEAYFYARHCTLGKFYTIAQYKKTLGCAYETARTSMDTLVSEGYYEKQKIKNKYIYTPKKR